MPPRCAPPPQHVPTSPLLTTSLGAPLLLAVPSGRKQCPAHTVSKTDTTSRRARRKLQTTQQRTGTLSQRRSWGPLGKLVWPQSKRSATMLRIERSKRGVSLALVRSSRTGRPIWASARVIRDQFVTCAGRGAGSCIECCGSPIVEG